MSNPQGKARITITLRKDLLPLLDNFIDGEKIRNRSHAIEFMVSQKLGLGVNKALVLAGDLNPENPEPLVKIHNRPVISYLIDQLKSFGITNIIIVIDETGRPVKEYLGDGVAWGVQITYLEDAARGTAKAMLLAKGLLKQPFVLAYGDVLADINWQDFIDFHKSHRGIGTIALAYSRKPEDFGVVKLQGSKIVDFVEKPSSKEVVGLVNSGIFLFEPKVFEYIESTSAISLEKHVLPKIAKDGKLVGYPFQGKWYDISRPENLKEAEQYWK